MEAYQFVIHFYGYVAGEDRKEAEKNLKRLIKELRKSGVPWVEKHNFFLSDNKPPIVDI